MASRCHRVRAGDECRASGDAHVRRFRVDARVRGTAQIRHERDRDAYRRACENVCAEARGVHDSARVSPAP